MLSQAERAKDTARGVLSSASDDEVGGFQPRLRGQFKKLITWIVFDHKRQDVPQIKHSEIS
jgi:hypothetical protein